MTGAAALTAAIGLAGAVGGTVLGTQLSASENEEAKKEFRGLRSRVKKWYERRRAEDYTLRPDAQALIRRQRELLDEKYKQARATNVVAGGTDEALALQKEAANKSLSDTMTGIAANAAEEKNKVESKYLEMDNYLTQQEINRRQQRAKAAAEAGGQLANAGMNLFGNSLSKIDA